MVSLGGCYQGAYGVPKDYKKAMSLYREAAELGDMEGMHHVGIMHEFGMGIPIDEKNAAKWYRKAADFGYTPSMVRLGIIYGCPGTLYDPVLCFQWFSKAHRLFSGEGTFYLGSCYKDAIGVEQDLVEAERLYRIAARLGFRWAELRLRNWPHQDAVAKDEKFEEPKRQVIPSVRMPSSNRYNWTPRRTVGLCPDGRRRRRERAGSADSDAAIR